MSEEKSISNLLQSLTDTELKVLNLIAQNFTSKEIAEKLFISYRTVQNHRYNISQKLKIKGSNKLLEFAIHNKGELQDLEPINKDKSISSELIKKKDFARFKIGITIVALLISIVLILAYLINPGDLFYKRNQNSYYDIITYERIAVLPFKLIGSNTGDEYLSEGLTQELITQISQMPGLRVIASSSVFTYKNASKQIKDIAKELGVSSILEGSIQKDKNKIRVSVSLINTNTEENLWVNTYDRDLKDLLSVQKDIASQVAVALKVELFLEGLEENKLMNPVNENTHIAYLKGKYFANQPTLENFEKAIQFYELAIRYDSTYAKAWAGLAEVYIWLANYSYLSPEEAYSKSKKIITKALKSAENISEVYSSIGAIHLIYDWDFKTAEVELLKAISLNPSNVEAHRLFALLQIALGDKDKAIQHSEITVKLDPLSALTNALYGRTLYFSKKFNDALVQYQVTEELNPDFWLINSYLGELFLEMNENVKAIEELKKAVKLNADSKIARAKLGYGYARTGNTAEAKNILAELIEYSQNGKVFSFQIVLIYTALNDFDNAFLWLQKAYENKHDFMLDLKLDPKLDPLRGDDRFEVFLNKMGLPI